MTPEEEATIRQIVIEELAKGNQYSNSNKTNTKNKTKRAPSQWQIHLKECIPKQDKDLGMGEKVKACSVEYKKAKNK